jgi:Fe-Mn family superoxide dismutase
MDMAFTLPKLPYAYDALEPHIDARTMEIHHTKHHQAYVDNVNKALEGQEELSKLTVDELVARINSVPEKIRTAVRNHGGGHANHAMFWTIMKSGGGGKPSGELARAIDDQLGGYDSFKQALSKAGMGRFGSGWAWLSLDANKKLIVEDTPNQDSPLMHGNFPVLGVDVWEHAYYLKYQNRRADYLEAWFNTIHWDMVNQRYQEGLKR